MTRSRTLLVILGLFVIFAGGAQARGWQDSAYYDQAQYAPGQGSGGILHFGPTTSKVAKIGLEAAGTVVAGLFGKQFGTLGMVVGGAAGFFVSKWIGDKLFGTHGYPRPSLWSKIRGRIGHDDDAEDAAERNARWHRLTHDDDAADWRERGQRWSKIRSLLPGGDDDLETARRNFFTAMQNLQGALATGSDADKQDAKTKYDAARDAYFAAKNR